MVTSNMFYPWTRKATFRSSVEGGALSSDLKGIFLKAAQACWTSLGTSFYSSVPRCFLALAETELRKRK